MPWCFSAFFWSIVKSGALKMKLMTKDFASVGKIGHDNTSFPWMLWIFNNNICWFDVKMGHISLMKMRQSSNNPAHDIGNITKVLRSPVDILAIEWCHLREGFSRYVLFYKIVEMPILVLFAGIRKGAVIKKAGQIFMR